MEKSKLIVSTKSTNSGKKASIIIVYAIMVLIFCIVLFAGDMKKVSYMMLGDSSYAWLLYVIIIGGAIYPLINILLSFARFNSYCDGYEKSVSGKTGMSFSNTKAPVQDFELSYNEILNVTASGKSIIIYTQYTNYEVSAFENQTEVVNAIRARMTGNK